MIEDTMTFWGCIVPSFLLMIAAGVGWCWNIVKFFGAANDPLTAMEVGRFFAIFLFPIGCIIGWF